MAFDTAFGSTLAISTTATNTTDTANQAAFESLAYTAIGEVESIGAMGDSYTPVTFTDLATGRVRKRKGSADAGDVQVVVAFDGADAGQTAVRTALASQGNAYAFRRQFNDGSDGSPSAPTTEYAVGYVMSGPIEVGSTDNVIRQTFTIAIDGAIVTVAAV